MWLGVGVVALKSEDAGRVSVELGAERRVHVAETVARSVTMAIGSSAPVAWRQSLQWSMTTMGMRASPMSACGVL